MILVNVRRCIKDLTEEVRLMKWAGHMVRMKDERLLIFRRNGRLQKMRKITAIMRGLPEDRSKEGRGGRKVDRKGQQGTMEKSNKSIPTAGCQLDQVIMITKLGLV